MKIVRFFKTILLDFGKQLWSFTKVLLALLTMTGLACLTLYGLGSFAVFMIGGVDTIQYIMKRYPTEWVEMLMMSGFGVIMVLWLVYAILAEVLRPFFKYCKNTWKSV